MDSKSLTFWSWLISTVFGVLLFFAFVSWSIPLIYFLIPLAVLTFAGCVYITYVYKFVSRYKGQVIGTYFTCLLTVVLAFFAYQQAQIAEQQNNIMETQADISRELKTIEERRFEANIHIVPRTPEKRFDNVAEFRIDLVNIGETPDSCEIVSPPESGWNCKNLTLGRDVIAKPDGEVPIDYDCNVTVDKKRGDTIDISFKVECDNDMEVSCLHYKYKKGVRGFEIEEGPNWIEC